MSNDAPRNGPNEVAQAETLTLQEAFRLAVALHRSDEKQAAESLYRRLLSVDPEHVDALHFLGILLASENRREEALPLLLKSIERAPAHPDFHNNLGNVYVEEGQLEAARDCYRRAIEINPDFGSAYYNLGNVLQRLGLLEDAIAVYRQAIALAPHLTQLRYPLGYTLASTGQIEAAEALFRQWMDLEPDNPLPRHYLMALTGKGTEERASKDYVTQTFDRFANSFDARLASLDYHAPTLVVEAVARYLPEAAAALAVLDAGCGTGLCAEGLRPWAASLTGVDLSPAMIAKAREKGGYDRLVVADLVDFLADTPGNWDLIVSADTLCYFGVLEEVAGLAARGLKPGGALVFSVEAANPEQSDDYHLNYNGRYSHTEAYVRRVLEKAGFCAVTLGQDSLRKEFGKPVAGYVVTATIERLPSD